MAKCNVIKVTTSAVMNSQLYLLSFKVTVLV